MRRLLATLTAASAIVMACSSSSAPDQCFGGCACFTTEAACKAGGCPWIGNVCSNGPADSAAE